MDDLARHLMWSDMAQFALAVCFLIHLFFYHGDRKR